MSDEIVAYALNLIKDLEEFTLRYGITKDIDGIHIVEDGNCQIPSEMSRKYAVELIKKGEAFPLV